MDHLPVAQIRAHIGFPRSKGDRIEVVVDGVPVAQLHPTSVAYEMDWNKGISSVVVRCIGGDADIETWRP